jgi:hypothetical protein
MAVGLNTPRLVKGGIVLVDPRSLTVQRTIALQYNPESITRTLEAQVIGGDGGDRSQAMRLTGPPVESIRFEAEIDATDQLDKAVPLAGQWGIQPQLAALESLVYPDSAQIVANQRLADQGSLEILPVESPLALLVWSQARIVPVRVTEFSITEEAFDARLNPIRAKLSLGMQVLSVSDLGLDHRGSNLYLTYQQQKERLAALAPRAGLSALGIGGIS